MDRHVVGNLADQIRSVRNRIESARRHGEDCDVCTALRVLHSLRLTLAWVSGEAKLSIRERASRSPGTSVSGFSCIKVPDSEPTLRKDGRAVAKADPYLAQVFDAAGAKLFDYQVILLVPELAADVINEAHARLVYENDQIRRDMRILRRAGREAVRLMDSGSSRRNGRSTVDAA